MGGTASAAIRSYYKIYDIDDDDYDMDTLRREWNRYYESVKKVTTYKTISGQRRTLIANDNKGRGNELASLLVAEHVEKFYTTSGRWNYALMRQLLTYVNRYVDYRPEKLPIRTIQHRVMMWKRFVQQHDDVAVSWEKLAG